MAKASTQFKKLNNKTALVNVAKKNISEGNKPKHKANPPKQQKPKDKQSTPAQQVKCAKQVKQAKPIQNTNSKKYDDALQQWFLTGIASSMVFKVFKVEGDLEQDWFYNKLVKHYDKEEKQPYYFLVNANHHFPPEDDKQSSKKYPRVKSIKELKDHNVEIILMDNTVLLAEVCISKKYIMEAILKYHQPALDKKSK